MLFGRYDDRPAWTASAPASSSFLQDRADHASVHVNLTRPPHLLRFQIPGIDLCRKLYIMQGRATILATLSSRSLFGASPLLRPSQRQVRLKSGVTICFCYAKHTTPSPWLLYDYRPSPAARRISKLESRSKVWKHGYAGGFTHVSSGNVSLTSQRRQDD